MNQPRNPLNSQVLEIFSPFATTPATPHYPEFTDRYSPQYVIVFIAFHDITLFFSFFPPLPHRFSITQPVQSRVRHHS